MRLGRVLCCALAIAACATLPARADEWNKQTFLTFSGPVQVPGATLPAGTYMFKLADLQGNRHVVQIFDKDGTKLYTTILAIPDQRLEPADKPVVLFSETPAGTPAAIKAWFYPGDTIGDEFVYPRQEAMRIAKTTHQPVLSRADESTDMKSAEVSRVDEGGNTVTSGQNAKANENANASQTAATTTANPDRSAAATAGTTGTVTPTTTDQSAATTTAQPSTSNANRPAATTDQAGANQNPDTTGGTTAQQQPAQRRGQLPKTASPLALYELVSGLALAGAFGIRRLRQSL